MKTDQALARALGGNHTDPIPDGPARLGARYRRSAAFRRRASGGDKTFDAMLLSAGDIARAARLRTIDMSSLQLDKPGAVEVETFPMPSLVPALIDIKTTGTMWHYFTGQQTLVGDGGGVPDGYGFGVPPSGMSLSFERELDEGIPFVVEAEVPTEIIDDAQAAEEALDTIMQLVWWRALEADLLSGDGSTSGDVKHLTGLLNTSGIGEMTRGTEWGGATIARAAATIGEQGFFDQPLAVVASPNTFASVLTVDDNSGRPLAPTLLAMIPQPTMLVPTLSLPDGTAVVGAWQRGMVLWVREALSLRITQNYLDYFARGLSRLQLRTRLINRVRHPEAFVVVSNL